MFLPLLLVPVKLSFLFLYHRYFFMYTKFIIACIIVGILVFVQWLLFTILVIVLCIPPARFWDPTIPGRCLNGKAVGDGFLISSLVTDFIILILPCPLIWRTTHFSKGQKIGLSVIFMLGSL